MSSRDVAYDNKDPSWNGDLAGWPTYVRKVRFHYEQTPKSKRKLLGPRLASKLTDKAWDILQSIDHEELRRPNGAKYLLLYLRERLGKTPVPDAGQKLEELFLRLRRAPGSSMATWAAQVREAYRGVQRALARTRQQEPQAERRTQQTSTTGFAPPGRPRSGATASEPQQEPASPQAATARESMSPPRLERISPEDDPREEYHSGAEEPGHEQWTYGDWSWRGWNWYAQGWQDSAWKKRDSDSEDEADFQDVLDWADLEVDDKEILPSEVLGWLLLRRAGLPASSRLSVQASVGNSLRFADLERALRDQEEELLAAEATRQQQRSHPRRTYWIEEDNQWALINEEIDEDALMLNPDSILWTSSPPPFVSTPAAEVSPEEDTYWFDGTYEWCYHSDGEWYAPTDDGAYVAYSEMKPWIDIEEIAYHDVSLGKELAEAFAVVHDKMRTFQEARHAVHQKGKTRGYFKPKGKSKGFKGYPSKGRGTVLASFGPGKGYGSQPTGSNSSLVNRPGYKGCFICGDKTNEFRSCPKRQHNPNSGSGKGGKAIYMVDDGVMGDSNGRAVEKTNAAPSSLPTCELPGVLAADAGDPSKDRLRFAVIDTGATETVGSMDALEFVLGQRHEYFGDEHVDIDTNTTKEFKFGNGQTRSASSFVCVPQTIGGQSTSLGVFALDVPNIPILIGIRTLQKLGAVVNVLETCLEFRSIFPGYRVPLVRGNNGHLLLDLCSDWCSEAPPIFTALTTSDNQGSDELENACTDESKDSCTEVCETVNVASSVMSSVNHTQVCEDVVGGCDHPTPVGESGSQEVVGSVDTSVSEAHEQKSMLAKADASKDQVSGSHLGTQESASVTYDLGHVDLSADGTYHYVFGTEGGTFSGGTEGQESEEFAEGDEEEGGRGLLGLRPCRGPGHEGPKVPRCPVLGTPRARSSRPWEHVGHEQVGQVGVLQDLPPPPPVHSEGRCPRAPPFGWSSCKGCQDRGGRDLWQTTGAVGDQGHCPPGRREVLGGSPGGGQEAESQGGAEGYCATASARESGLCSDPIFGIQEVNQARRGAGSGDHGSDGQPDIANRGRVDHPSSHPGGDHSVSEELSDPLVQPLSASDRNFLVTALTQSEDDMVEAFTTFSSNRVDLVEVCCGPNSLLSQVVEQFGGTSERIGLFNGFDMSTSKGLEKARRLVAQRRPRWLWFALPCGPTSPIQHLNELTPEGLARSLKRKQKSRKTCRNCVKLAEEHVLEGGDIGWEWPRNNEAWYFPEVKRFMKFLEARDLYFPARLDGCMVGMVAPDCGVPMRKPWRIVSTRKDLSSRLDLQCDKQHDHVECMGHDRAAHSAFYTPKMCRLITKVVLTPRDDSSTVFGIEETTNLDDIIKDVPPETLGPMKDAIHKLHIRSGHPSNQALVNCLKARGVSKIVLALAREHVCDSCQEVRLPKPHMTVSLSKCEVLWHTLQIDHGQVRIGDQVLNILFFIDEASHFMNACEMCRHHHTESRHSTTEEVIRAVETFWCQYHGYPSVLKYDPEGAFRGHNFILWGQERGIEMRPCAAEDHGAIGDVESLIKK